MEKHGFSRLGSFFFGCLGIFCFHLYCLLHAGVIIVVQSVLSLFYFFSPPNRKNEFSGATAPLVYFIRCLV